MNTADSVESSNFVVKPTHTDVLLGRGVGTNRHTGNTNFRHIVSKYVREYVTSTKTEKISITRGIDRVQTQLNPPGRFLEKDQHSGMWKEVDIKRAHEKTAQALRDGAAPLRKRLSDEITSDPLFLLDVFNSNSDAKRPCKKSRTSASANAKRPLQPTKEKKVQLQTKSTRGVTPPPTSSSATLDQWLSALDVPLISPSQSPVSSINEFDLPFQLVDFQRYAVSIDVVEMADDEILQLWDAS